MTATYKQSGTDQVQIGTSLDSPDWISVQEDITEQKQADQKLRKSEEKFRTICEHAPVMIDAFDQDGRCLLWNRECEKRLGWKREEIFACADPLSLFYPDPGVRNHVLEVIKKADGTFREYDVLAKDGSNRIQLWADFRVPSGTLISVGYDITERKRAEEQIKASLGEKKTLLKEIHHRVKNNLQVISSLLDLQAESHTHPQILQALTDNQNRVHSMALIHEHLYDSDNFKQINFARYISDLMYSLLNLHNTPLSNVALEFNLDELYLDIDIAIPCGLILNELVSNCYKHAFLGERKGKIHITFCLEGDNQFVLIIRDNGIGFPESLNFRETKSLGLQLICTLTNQLEGTITLDRDGGTVFRIAFPAKASEEITNGEVV